MIRLAAVELWLCVCLFGCGDGRGTNNVVPHGSKLRGAGSIDSPPEWTVELSEDVGEPVSDQLEVALVPVESQDFPPAPQVLRGTQGRFGAALRRGRYEPRLVSVVVRRGMRDVSLAVSRLEILPPVVVVGPAQAEPFALVVQRRRGSGRISVKASAEDGQPLGDAAVEILQDSSRRVLEDVVAKIQTSPDGTGSASGLLAGRYRVRLVDAGDFGETERQEPDFSAERRTDCELSEGGTQVVHIVVAAAGVVKGRIRRADSDAGKLTVVARRLWPDGVWRPLANSDLALVGTAFVARGLVPGKYRFVVSAQGREVRTTEVDVRAGKIVHLDIDTGPESTTRVALECHPEAAPLVSEAFNFNRADDPLAGDVALGTLKSGDTTSLDIPAAPRPGQYLLILWSRRIAMLCNVTAEPSQKIQISPPETVAASGSSTLKVRVEDKEGRPVQRMFVGLRPTSQMGPWLRFEETWPVASFCGIARGEYEILVFDGVFGVTAGFKVQPCRVVVSLEKDEVEAIVRPVR